MAKLAVLGGTPVIDEALDWTTIWPPRDEVTANRLRELYFSGKWSAFDDVEPAFAKAFAEHHDSRYGVFTINGTVTLHIALAAMGIGPGDEVIIPPLTWFATAMAVRYVGATPVFVDIRPDTLCIDPDKVEAAITPRTRAIIPVHTYGAFADMERIMAIAQQHELRVLEDCAHAHGAIWNGQRAGSIGDVGSFSFQGSKTMACSEGGICITSDDELYDRMFRVKQIGYAPGEKPRTNKVGPPDDLMCYNFRATTFHPVILEEQLRHLDDRLAKYNRAVAYIEDRLTASTPVRFQARDPKTDVQGYFLWIPIFDAPEFSDIPLSVVRDAIAAEGLNLWPMDGPMYQFVQFNIAKDDYRMPEPCTVTEAISETALSMHHALLGQPDEEIQMIAEAIEKVATNLDELRKFAANQA